MKLYIWKHKNTANTPQNFYPLAKVREIKPNGFDPVFPDLEDAYFSYIKSYVT